MPKRVALATSEDYRLLSDDDRALIAPLAAHGISAQPAIWTDPGFSWNACDAVIVRSCWDYHLKPAKFLDWVASLAQAGVPLWNPPEMLRWNTNKIYLRDLEARGVKVIPTLWPEEPVNLREELAKARWERAVLKPRISATAHRTALITNDNAEQAHELLHELQRGPGAMIQKFVDDILERGEWSLIFFAGEFSHAVIKTPKAGDFRVQHDFGGSVTHAQPSPALIDAAAHAVIAVSPRPLYARVDGVESDGVLLLMELELIEPGLFLTSTPRAAARFADAILKTL